MWGCRGRSKCHWGCKIRAADINYLMIMHVRFGALNGLNRAIALGPKLPRATYAPQQLPLLFNHLGAGGQRSWDGEAECLRPKSFSRRGRSQFGGEQRPAPGSTSPGINGFCDEAVGFEPSMVLRAGSSSPLRGTRTRTVTSAAPFRIRAPQMRKTNLRLSNVAALAGVGCGDEPVEHSYGRPAVKRRPLGTRPRRRCLRMACRK
jgi:hypothetical protein